ncbi:MAG: CDP-diacylglycerol--glycerol-3-phosphate 3-phosphatidyltransferase [Atopobiaceae bacterium]|jgi:CDP-diacylglycerol--glycerol-3-phosphate 3-phosphatidyltransferase|nr:CDP-diacylglycerol--glycerol-3-phosphate 3-phosphatidyltransferase [Atopobiaceae bacterium]MCH4180895.1 CDP-diacylglycerol--glycerol-3-phosphate 3-phosphatidyltransferase [Atopobiaceae bacterium]MCH4213978.1 CDP-diacylglycerol--glycerol-3-phosphate 3-phosphatidyltransferase [Atopobiaceae bacterium]MCH4230636.1 CDP-diacylglycerol--glycerol-3-phosphate 3-phosphatidyltransferase [Atopobiaceae bacterium]MCH4275559.1 CDP-diacylglycerol--glycerol-3-phosphate 3-phosphatidyltransferase [Atopobiaceae
MSRRSIWTPANVVTCVRVVATFGWLALAEAAPLPDGTSISAWGLAVAFAFGIIALTDKLDGYLARSRGEVTVFGKFLDPIADKLVVICALLVLVQWDLTSVWVPFIIVTREFLVSGLRMVLSADGTVVAASGLGKWKTATTMGAIAGLLVARACPAGACADALFLVSNFVMAAAVVLTVVSGIDYFMKGKDVLFGGARDED